MLVCNIFSVVFGLIHLDIHVFNCGFVESFLVGAVRACFLLEHLSTPLSACRP